jgi:pimeloyl-ACP methyl ester carboxylesterase
MDLGWESHRRQVDGYVIHWRAMGQGRPLVLLHGLSDSHRTWRRVVPLLAKTRRVLVPDLLGHGLSARPDAPYDLAWHARTIGRWMESLGLEDVDLVGHSYGGGVAQYLLLSHRDRIRRLALVAPGGLGREVSVWLRMASLPLPTRLIQPLMGLGTHLGLRLVAGGHYNRRERGALARFNSQPGSARAFKRTVRGVISRKGQHVHFFQRAHEVKALPAIGLFWGAKDPVIPAAHGADATRRIEGVHFTHFQGCGHFPHLEAPRRFTAALMGFLDSRDVRPACLPSVRAVQPSERRRRGA